MLFEFIRSICMTRALPFAQWFAMAWTSLYTAAAPEDEREARRDEVRSDLYEHVADSREEGCGPVEIGFQIVARVVLGMKDDVVWVAPRSAASLAERLERGSAAFGRDGRLDFLIAALALAGVMNSGFIVSEGDRTWGEWLLMNAAMLCGIALLWRQRRLRARHVLLVLGVTALSGTSAWALWTVLHYRLYEAPGFYGTLLQAALAALPLLLGMAVRSETCRVRVFGGRRWPTYASWGVIAAVSVGAALLTGLTALLNIWVVMAVLALGSCALLAVFLGGSAVVCHGALKGGVACLRLMAKVAD